MSWDNTLEELFQHPGWIKLIELERAFRDDEILKMMKVPLDDPSYERKVSHHRSLALAIAQLWNLRDTLRRDHKRKDRDEDQVPKTT